MRMTMRFLIVGMLSFLPWRLQQASAEVPTVTQVSQEVVGFTSLNTLRLIAGKSAVLSFVHMINKISIGNPVVADFNLLGPQQILVTGKTAGITNIVVVVDEVGTLTPIDVVVDAPPEVAMVKVGGSPVLCPVVPKIESRWISSRVLRIPILVLPLFGLVAFFEPMVRRGRGRWFVLGWIWMFFILAELSMAWGMAALGHGVGIREAGPMVGASVLVVAVTLLTGPRVSRRYYRVEMDRMRVMDSA